MQNIYFIYEKKINYDNNIDFLFIPVTAQKKLTSRKRNTAQSQEHKFIKFNPVLENLLC